MRHSRWVLLGVWALITSAATLAEERFDPSTGATMFAEYFRAETSRISANCLADIKTLDDWNSHRGESWRQLFEMLSLERLPLPKA